MNNYSEIKKQSLTYNSIAYTFQIQKYTLAISLKKQVLLLEIKQQQIDECFEIQINHQYINTDKILSFLYSSPASLFHHILANIHSLKISSQYIIKIEFLWNSQHKQLCFPCQQKKKIDNQMIFSLIKNMKIYQQMNFMKLQKAIEAIKLDKEEFVSLQRYEQNKEHIFIELERMKNGFDDLNYEICKIKEQNLLYQFQLQSQKKRTIQIRKQYHHDKQVLKKQVQHLYAELHILIDHKEPRLRPLFHSMNPQQQNNSIRQIQIKQSNSCKAIIDYNSAKAIDMLTQNRRMDKVIDKNDEVSECQNSIIIQQSAYNKILQLRSLSIPQNSHCQSFDDQNQIQNKTLIQEQNNHHFQTKLTKGKVLIKFKQHSIYYSFINPKNIQKNKITKLSVRQTKTINQAVMYGIGTHKIAGIQSPYKHMQSKVYNSYNGKLWQNGYGKKVGPVIKDGDIVTIIVDLINWAVTWQINKIDVAFTSINKQWKEKHIYFIITMAHKQDEVQILTQE